MNDQYDEIKKIIAEVKQDAISKGDSAVVFDKVLKRTMKAIHDRRSLEEIAQISQEDIQKAKDDGTLKFGGGRKSRKSLRRRKLRRRKSTRRHKMH
jgi:hypothetical protein